MPRAVNDKVRVTPSTAPGHQAHDGVIIEVLIQDHLYRVQEQHGNKHIWRRDESELSAPLAGH